MKNKIDFKLEAKRELDKTVVYLYGDIVDKVPKNWMTGEEEKGDFITPKNTRELFESIDTEKIELHLNSFGGSVFASVSILNYLKNLNKDITVIVDGIVASGGSIIAMCGNKIIMPKNATMMIHRASTFGFGNCKELRKIADTLEKIDSSTVLETYKERFKGTEEELQTMLDKETWLKADECLKYGLCDEVKEFKKEELTDSEANNLLKFMTNFANLKIKEI